MKRNVFPALFASLLLFGFLSCSSDDDAGPQTPQEVVATVSFSITTDTAGKPATITYTDAGSSEATLANETLPWTDNYTGNFSPGETIVLKAVSTVPGQMTATLTINGEVVATATDEDEINLSGVVN
ncbi:MAG: hypothetical protein ABJM06_09425 [Gilvibacter sp.]